jgi:hypothetical protein
LSAPFQPLSPRCFVLLPQRLCTRLRIILEKTTLKAVAHDFLRIYGSSRLLKKTLLLRVRKPVVTLCRFSCRSLCAYLPTIAHFYRHFHIIDKILTDSQPAKARSISLAALLKPTLNYTAVYYSMNTDQLIFLLFPLPPVYDFPCVANGDGAGTASHYVLILPMCPRRSCNRGCTRYDTPDNDALPWSDALDVLL